MLLLPPLIIGCEAQERNAAEDIDTTRVAEQPVSAEAPADAPTVLFVGTSLTAGFGLATDEAYPALVQAKIDSAGLPHRVVNAGVSGETSAGALRRIDWLLRRPFDVLVLETGANDMLRGTDLDSTRANIQEIIDRVRAERPGVEIVLAGLRAPPNLGAEYTEEFRSLYPELAEANGVALVPRLLEDVGGHTELNQADGIHPNAQGQRILAENVWEVLEPVLRAGHPRPGNAS